MTTIHEDYKKAKGLRREKMIQQSLDLSDQGRVKLVSDRDMLAPVAEELEEAERGTTAGNRRDKITKEDVELMFNSQRERCCRFRL